MKKPAPAPSIAELIASVPSERLVHVVQSGRGALVEGEYLHWDDLRHRTPPRGLSHREWWLTVSMARLHIREHVPLLDASGAPFHLVYTPPLRERLHRIDQRFGMTPSPDVGSLVEAHGPGYVLASSLMEEAIRSSQLEGAVTTREAAKEMIRRQRTPRDRGERMILNNYRAMGRLEELAERPLNPEDVLELHRILVDGTLDEPRGAGAFRSAEDHVVVELLHSIETAHIPPPATGLAERMDRLLAFANGETPDVWIHPVLRASIVHFMMGYDHPFVDGNGRTARALFYWVLLRHGYPLARYVSISAILRKAPARYARAYLLTETDHGDLTYFVEHQVDVLLKGIEALEGYLQGKLLAVRRAEARLRTAPDLNHRQLALMAHALRHPGFEYTVQSHRRSHRVAENTARADLVDLATRGLLVQGRRGRAHVFLPPRDLSERV